MGVLEEEDIKRKQVHRSLLAAKKRISPQTGWIHLFVEDPQDARQDTIPFVENFFYVLTLMRSKLLESMQEGKILLQRLLAFEVEGNVPYYLHEFPLCRDLELSSQLLAPIFYLLRDFSLGLGEELTQRLQEFANRICALPMQSSFAKARQDAFLGGGDLTHLYPRNPQEWGEYCVLAQMTGQCIDRVLSVWEPCLGVFIGQCPERRQENGEPCVTLLDLFMGEYFEDSPRAENIDLPVLLRASIVYPFSEKKEPLPQSLPIVLKDPGKRHPLTFYFGSKEKVASLVCEVKKGSVQIEEGENIQILYEFEEVEEELLGICFYLSREKDSPIKVNGERSTVFQSGDRLTFGVFTLCVKEAPDGVGHIWMGDRSYQKGCGDDWKIGWRALKKGPLVFEISIENQKDREEFSLFSSRVNR